MCWRNSILLRVVVVGWLIESRDDLVNSFFSAATISGFRSWIKNWCGWVLCPLPDV